MELDDLKEAWAALDNRLKKNEKLNESIILEMIRSKVVKKVNRFIAWEVISFTVLILIIPFCIYLFDILGGKYLAFDLYILFTAAISFVYTFWSVYKLHGLMKFDITKNIGNNILCMNRYNIQLKREKKILTYFVGPVFVALAVVMYASMKATLPLWILLVCLIIIATLGNYWTYKKYDKSIESVVRSLDEIRELKEE